MPPSTPEIEAGTIAAGRLAVKLKVLLDTRGA
jgi:hypothetical protein